MDQWYWSSVVTTGVSENQAELCAKVILAAVGDSEVTFEYSQSKSYQLFACTDCTVHGSVPGGARARLKRLARENPVQLLRLLESAQHRLPPSSML